MVMIMPFIDDIINCKNAVQYSSPVNRDYHHLCHALHPFTKFTDQQSCACIINSNAEDNPSCLH